MSIYDDREKAAIMLAWRDYHDAVGNVVEVYNLNGEYPDGNIFELDTKIPIKVKVLDNSDGVDRWVDENWLDPTWEVEIAESHPEVPDGIVSTWCYGNSYNVNELTPIEILAAEIYES